MSKKKQLSGVERIAAERKRQIEEEGFEAKHDDYNMGGELINAAIVYLLSPKMRETNMVVSGMRPSLLSFFWPWSYEWFKPSVNRIRELEKAGALIAAEIDRLLRLEA